MENCKGCGKPMLWAKNENGKMIPLDPKAPVWAMTGEAENDGALPLVERAPNAFVTHFATCPQANRFSGASKKAGNAPGKPATPAGAQPAPGPQPARSGSNLPGKALALLALLSLICSPAAAQEGNKGGAGGNLRGKGWATYYTVESCRAEGTSGVLTASGEIYRESRLTCALPDRRFGRMVKVKSKKTGKTVIVKHTDFGPGKKAIARGVIIDLTPAAFKALGHDLREGRIEVEVSDG